MSAQAGSVSDVAQIPVIDFAGFARGAAAERAATAAALRAALEQYGFLYLRGHDVPQSVLDTLFTEARAFFALPLAAKEAVKPGERGSTRGYGGVASQALDETQPGDLKEVFQAGPEPAAQRQNVWPADRPQFRAAVLTFHTAAVATC